MGDVMVPPNMIALLQVSLLNRDGKHPQGSILISLSHRPGFFRYYYNDGTRRGNVTDGRTGLAGTTIRDPPDPPEGGGLPDARLNRRGRRRRAGSLAAPQPLGHQRRPEPGRMADDRRQPG